MKIYEITYKNAYNETCTTRERAQTEQEVIEKFKSWMPEGTITEIKELISLV